jgi:hypothetical protein
MSYLASRGLNLLFLKSFQLALLALVAYVVQKSDVDKFQQFHTKARASALLKLDDGVYGGGASVHFFFGTR